MAGFAHIWPSIGTL